ncbi:hypothetical protein D3C75_810850 [compost metagenome]
MKGNPLRFGFGVLPAVVLVVEFALGAVLVTGLVIALVFVPDFAAGPAAQIGFEAQIVPVTVLATGFVVEPEAGFAFDSVIAAEIESVSAPQPFPGSIALEKRNFFYGLLFFVPYK